MSIAAAEVSAGSFTVPRVIHPWRRFRRLAHLTLAWHQPSEHDGAYGVTNFETNTISLRADLNQAGRRSTILHELLHAERGPVLDTPTLVAREELRVRREAARLLLPDIHAVGDALAWARCTAEAADELWVDEDTLLDRLEHLHPSELHFLRGRLEHAEVP